ncbi:helix-turn-helix transcriptional regulator [Pseudoruegeria sp. SHC-113]|uniref:helix-turn-helix transcriptional regulator n=1 Tax=Pseudoruegeria sp. SHC-113 TaxID=2855439 RepID=UPI0021BAF85D|nr:helix-turn-helix transcriptional regulator [Pseudoruegeria sp. SHC-113]MCT8159706.1 helix-turn-helix transcriptional regulator [Pseudoruegeria sp. SHC-113]
MTRHPLLWGLFALQAFCALFFTGDALVDVLGLEGRLPFAESDTFEYVISAALVLSLVFTGRELRRAARREKNMERQIGIASGAFAELLAEQFADWDLTATERDVALLAIKGLSVAEMAEVRSVAEGTVKAQCAAVYRKAGVSGRLQLMSLFLDELMADGLPMREAAPT